MTDAIEPFHLAIPEAALDDIKARLARTRWPERETVTDASEGVRLADAQALCAYWRDTYEWRRCEAGEPSHFRGWIDRPARRLQHLPE